MSIRIRVDSVEEDFFTSSRSQSICPATLGWAWICKQHGRIKLNYAFSNGFTKGVGLSTMVGLLHCDLGVTGSKHRNSLSACRGKAAYI